jgi:hypothetical protein
MLRYKDRYMGCALSSVSSSSVLSKQATVHRWQPPPPPQVIMSEQILDAVNLVLSEQHRFELGVFLGSLLVVTFLARRLRRWYRLSHIPGPPLAGFSRWFWLVPSGRSGQLTERMRQVESKYGEGPAPHNNISSISKPSQAVSRGWGRTRSSHQTGSSGDASWPSGLPTCGRSASRASGWIQLRTTSSPSPMIRNTAGSAPL